jgi:polyphosphate kinase
MSASDFPLHSRELSWLAFNQRVLLEAQNPAVPLLERLKFIAIFSSNLDEYFKVRVATMRRLVKLKKKTRAKLAQNPADALRVVLEEVGRLQHAFGETFREQILPALANEHIHLLTDDADFTPEQRAWVMRYAQEHVRPLLAGAVALDQLPGPLFLKDTAVYMLFRLTRPRRADLPQERVVVAELPTKAHGGRFVKLPTEGNEHVVAFLDDVLRAAAPDLFPDYERAQAWAIKLSRDAELDLEEEVSGDLLAKIKKGLKKRETGFPARLLYDPEIQPAVMMQVAERAGIRADELVEGGRYHNFRDFFGFPNLGRTDLQYPPEPALPHPGLARRRKLFKAIGERDYLLHFPYQSFDYVLKLFREAAADPAVTAIAVTLYRVAAKSEIAKALVKAAKAGKQVTVVVELKARFDEESNIYWATKLEKAGANVIYGFPDLKVHTKLALFTRAEGEALRQYAFLSTGNFNEQTSRIYADYALMTADPRLTREVGQVFAFLTDRQREGKTFEHLLVAPFNLRERLTELIKDEIANAKAGKPAYILLKLNALEDEDMIRLLYRAAQAGVRVDLNVRGISCLLPDVSDNLHTRAIVDRYLEHGRVYVFANGGGPENELLYIASADWMNRNLSRRVEAAFPLYDPTLRAEIRELIDIQQQDTEKARDFRNASLRGSKSAASVRAQGATYERLRTGNARP